MKLAMNLFAPRERAALLSKTKTDTSFINPLKVVVAKMQPPDEWDRCFFAATVVGNALIRLQEYNTCPRPEWTWWVPGTPVRIFLPTHDNVAPEAKYVFPVAHPKSADKDLELIWDRPRQDVYDAVKALIEAGFPGINELSIESDDVNSRFYTLRWRGTKFPETLNVMYIHRGIDKPHRKRNRGKVKQAA